jgi:hypothetical protein
MSSEYSIGSDIKFILRGGSFMYIMSNRGPRIYPWRIPCFSVAQSEKNVLVVLSDVTSNFCLLLVK